VCGRAAAHHQDAGGEAGSQASHSRRAPMSRPLQPQPAHVLPLEAITHRILLLREQKVLLDSDLAALYGVETRRLNERVRRNQERFPKDFIFELTAEEFANLKSQFATSSWGGLHKLPLAFTEHGAIMGATVLNSPRAVEVSVYVVRGQCFVDPSASPGELLQCAEGAKQSILCLLARPHHVGNARHAGTNWRGDHVVQTRQRRTGLREEPLVSRVLRRVRRIEGHVSQNVSIPAIGPSAADFAEALIGARSDTLVIEFGRELVARSSASNRQPACA